MSSREEKLKFMRIAYKEAMRAREKEEIPVGAVIVKDGEIISKGHNRNREKNDATMHAEIIAITKASKKLKSERLLDCELYVTKEPCPMCAGAIINARLKKVIIAAEDVKYGACGTVLSVCGNNKLNHVPEIEFGILRDESSSILKDFFKKLRK
ncbi:MAG: tRNA adenosine(34) deaminase TadA [Spirochaetes bacterium]|jgi:tRNA(adenine34) deaminase|nr:tRNA adenosine(34) deaminase TadA [Spirochaetota bacterium]